MNLGRAIKIGGGKGFEPATRPLEEESYLDKGPVHSRVEHPRRSVFFEVRIMVPTFDKAEPSGLDGNQVTQRSLGVVPDRVVQESDGAFPTESQRIAVVVFQTFFKFQPSDGHVLCVIHADRDGGATRSADSQFVLDIEPFGKEVGTAISSPTQREDKAGPVFDSLPLGMDRVPGRKCLTSETESGDRGICGLQ